jgi:hypothetical protein
MILFFAFFDLEDLLLCTGQWAILTRLRAAGEESAVNLKVE